MITSATYNMTVTTRPEFDRMVEQLQRNHPDLMPTNMTYRQRVTYTPGGGGSTYHNDFSASVTFSALTQNQPDGAVTNDFID